MPLTPAQLATDVAAMYGGDFAVTVVYGSFTTQGIEDIYDEGNPMPDENYSDIGRFVTVRIAAGSLGALTTETAITVGGVAMRLRSFDRLGDGLETLLRCQA